MPAAINAASATSPDALGARASSGSSGSGAAQEPRRREFSEVLRDTSAKSRTEKANSASTDERPGDAQSAEATARPGTETAQAAGEGKAAAEAAADQTADALATDADPTGGSDLPPWLNIVAESLPAARTSPPAVAGASVDGSAPLAVAPSALDAVSTSTGPGAVGKASASLDTALTGREASAARGGSPYAPLGPIGSGAHASVANEPLHAGVPAIGASGHGNELVATVAGETGAAADRAAATTTRFDTAVVLAQTSSGSATTSQVTQSPTPSATATSIPLPLNHPHWQEAFASRVVWQVKDGLQQVNVAINPPELGPIEVRMSLQDDKVSAQFVTAHHAVRQVIEDAMPRLREMLSQSGLNLADANVFQQAPGRDGHDQQFAGGAPNVDANDLAGVEEDVASHATATLHAGLVDAYV
ncbi:MAG: flagellar hook-length control protein FliK [Gammaproteobacteria bacterium]